MLIHWIWLSRLPKVSASLKIALLYQFHDPEEIYEAGEDAFAAVDGITEKAVESLLNKDMTEAERILKQCSEKSISILTYADSGYPNRLRNTYEPPAVIYYKGRLPKWETVPAIGIVGTRKASGYGMQISQRMGAEIAACGGLVVSGGADGIDTQALVGAMKTGKPVVAVLGCGADVVYPAKNKGLFAQIEKQGCLLTEYAPGTPPHSWNFPQRNRIISGLSVGVLVVEAPEQSGALSTARHALEQGRDLFVVPGNIDSPNSIGSNALLREGAIASLSGWDVMREYENLYPGVVYRRESRHYADLMVAEKAQYPRIEPQKVSAADKKSIDNREKSQYSVMEKVQKDLSEEEKRVLQFVTLSPQNVDSIIAESELPAGKVLSILTMLAMKGVVQNHPGKCVSLKSS